MCAMLKQSLFRKKKNIWRN